MAIYQKITGAQIKDFDEDFWVHNFGIEGVNEHQKLRFEIARNLKGRLIKQDVFAWGNNNHG